MLIDYYVAAVYRVSTIKKYKKTEAALYKYALMLKMQ
jgi:hypothetical protein